MEVGKVMKLNVSPNSKGSGETNGYVDFKQMVQFTRAGRRAFACVVWKQDRTNLYSEYKYIQLHDPSNSGEQKRSRSLLLGKDFADGSPKSTLSG